MVAIYYMYNMHKIYVQFTIGYIFWIYYKLPRECMYVNIIYHLRGNIYGSITLDIGQYMSYIAFLYGLNLLMTELRNT